MNNNLLNIAKEIFDSHDMYTYVTQNDVGIMLLDEKCNSIFYEYIKIHRKLLFAYPKILLFNPYDDSCYDKLSNIILRFENVSFFDFDKKLIERLTETYVKLIECIKYARHDCAADIEELTKLYHTKSEIKPLSTVNAITIPYTDLLIEQQTKHLNAKLNQLFKIYSQEIQLFS